MSERIDHSDMLQRVQAAREGWMVPGAYLVQAHDDAQSLNRIVDDLAAERDALREHLATATARAEAAEAVLNDLQTVMEYADIDFAGWGIPGQEEAYNRLNEWLYLPRRAAQP